MPFGLLNGTHLLPYRHSYSTWTKFGKWNPWSTRWNATAFTVKSHWALWPLRLRFMTMLAIQTGHAVSKSWEERKGGLWSHRRSSACECGIYASKHKCRRAKSAFPGSGHAVCALRLYSMTVMHSNICGHIVFWDCFGIQTVFFKGSNVISKIPSTKCLYELNACTNNHF